MNIKIITFLISIIAIIPISVDAQIKFKEDNEDLINIGQVGTINSFVREINNDSIYVVWKILDLKATGSDNLFMAYEREAHDVQFGITYKDLDKLSSWITQRQKSKTGGAVTIGDWEFSYVQSALGVPIFMLTGPTGNFEVGFNKTMRTRLLNEESIKREIERYKYRKAREEKRDARRKKNK